MLKYRDTLKSFVWSSMNYDIKLILKTDYSKLYFLNSELRISSAVKHLGIIIIKHCEALKNDNILRIIDQEQFYCFYCNARLLF